MRSVPISGEVYAATGIVCLPWSAARVVKTPYRLCPIKGSEAMSLLSPP